MFSKLVAPPVSALLVLLTFDVYRNLLYRYGSYPGYGSTDGSSGGYNAPPPVGFHSPKVHGLLDVH